MKLDFLANVYEELNKLKLAEKPNCSLNNNDNKSRPPTCQTTIKFNQSKQNLMNVK